MLLTVEVAGHNQVTMNQRDGTFTVAGNSFTEEQVLLAVLQHSFIIAPVEVRDKSGRIVKEVHEYMLANAYDAIWIMGKLGKEIHQAQNPSSEDLIALAAMMDVGSDRYYSYLCNLYYKRFHALPEKFHDVANKYGYSLPPCHA